jgi:hypothetical protein
MYRFPALDLSPQVKAGSFRASFPETENSTGPSFLKDKPNDFSCRSRDIELGVVGNFVD